MSRVSSVSFGCVVVAMAIGSGGCTISAQTKDRFTEANYILTDTQAWAGESISINIQGVPIAENGGVTVIADPNLAGGLMTANARLLAMANSDDKPSADQSIADAKATFCAFSRTTAGEIDIACGHGSSHGSSDGGQSGCELVEIHVPIGSATQKVNLKVLSGNGTMTLTLNAATIGTVGTGETRMAPVVTLSRTCRRHAGRQHQLGERASGRHDDHASDGVLCRQPRHRSRPGRDQRWPVHRHHRPWRRCDPGSRYGRRRSRIVEDHVGTVRRVVRQDHAGRRLTTKPPGFRLKTKHAADGAFEREGVEERLLQDVVERRELHLLVVRLARRLPRVERDHDPLPPRAARDPPPTCRRGISPCARGTRSATSGRRCGRSGVARGRSRSRRRSRPARTQCASTTGGSGASCARLRRPRRGNRASSRSPRAL